MNSTECYTITNFTLRVVDGEPDFTLDKSLGDCKFSDALYFIFMKLYYELLLDSNHIRKRKKKYNATYFLAECLYI